MKSLVGLLLVFALCQAVAQPVPGGQQWERQHMQRDHTGPMPPAERRMSWEDRQRLREEVRSGNMTRDEARERWRQQREQRGLEPGRSPEERQQLRRDVQDAIRALDKR